MSQLNPPRIFVSERPDLYGLAVVKTDYTLKGRICMSRRHIFTERQRAALVAATDELSLLKFYTLGDDPKTLAAPQTGNRIGFAPATLCLTISGPCTGSGEMIPRSPFLRRCSAWSSG